MAKKQATNLYEMTATDLAGLLKKKKASSVEITRSLLDRIDKVDEKVRAYVTVTGDLAIKMAEEADRRLASGDTETPHRCAYRGQGQYVRAGLQDHVRISYPGRLCASVRCDRSSASARAGDAHTGSGQHGRVRHGVFHGDLLPWSDLQPLGARPHSWRVKRWPSGRGCGREAPVSLGSDTGGSIRLPASFCGVTGIKPTYGAVSRYGLVAYASSLDQIGPVTVDARDCAMMLNVICGHDPMDSTSVDMEHPDFTTFLGKRVKGMTLGVPTEFFRSLDNPEVEGAMSEARAALEEERGRIRRPVAPPPGLWNRSVLHHCAQRGLVQPGALRRGKIRAQG